MPKFGTLPKGQNAVRRDIVERAERNQAATKTPVATAPFNSFPYAVDAGRITLPLIMAAILVFLDFGRPFDQNIFIGYHIPVTLCILGGVVTLFTRWTSSIRTRVGVSLVFFVIAACVSTLFSTWRGGSVNYLENLVEVDLILFCLLSAAPTTVGQVRWLAIAIVFSTSFNFIIGTKFDLNGRLVLKDWTIGNSDDVALFAGFCIPLVILLAQRLNKVLGFIVGAVGIGACLTAVELSGTRFALVALAVLAAVYFFRGSGAQRIVILVAAVVIAVGSVVLLPKNIAARLATITSVVDDSSTYAPGQGEALDSTKARGELFRDGVSAFLSHPILGVGPAQFMNWRWGALAKHGQPTHNTYVQVAAEEGIIGLVTYLVFCIGCLVTLQRCIKPFEGWSDGQQLAKALQASLIYFFTSAITLTCDLHAQQYAVAGLAIALDRIRQEQLAGASETAVAQDPRKTVSRPPVVPMPKPLPVRPEPAATTTPARPVSYRFNRLVAMRKD